jgi:hypothetical protein
MKVPGLLGILAPVSVVRCFNQALLPDHFGRAFFIDYSCTWQAYPHVVWSRQSAS